MKLRTLATLTCVGFLAATSAYADDTQATDSQMLADSTNTTAQPLAPADSANAPGSENVGSPDMSNQSALNNAPTSTEDLASGNGGNEMSPDTATGDDY